MNYYNEFHPPAAAILRGLIADKLIPEGHVDDRSIEDVQSNDLKGYTQCHFFAGIGGWPYALQLAGWPADRPVWTGSCPCQPFSTAGRQKGKADERHLWPIWNGLIRECRPPVVFGEQVASAVAHGWLDDVYQGLEAEGYAIGAAVLPACSVGAPHKRDRLWFVAHAESVIDKRAIRERSATPWRSEGNNGDKFTGASDGHIVAYSECFGQQGQGEYSEPLHTTPDKTWETDRSDGAGAGNWQGLWIDCPDGKQRLTEPSIRLLAYGFPERVACLHGFGNAIVPQVAAEFIKAYMNIDGELYAEVK